MDKQTLLNLRDSFLEKAHESNTISESNGSTVVGFDYLGQSKAFIKAWEMVNELLNPKPKGERPNGK